MRGGGDATVRHVYLASTFEANGRPRREKLEGRFASMAHCAMVLDAPGSPKTATPDMRDLMAAVGEVLLCWGYVENAILDRLATLGGAAAKPSKASPLARWKRAETPTGEVTKLHDEIERLADIRNVLAHGLASATVDPKDTRGAGVVCRTPSGDRHIPFTTLTETRRSLFRLSHAIRDVAIAIQEPAKRL